jgi:hypothetical protein
MIVGFDHDDPDIFQEHVDFLQAAKIPNPMVNRLEALPTTPLYERLKKEGRLLSDGPLAPTPNINFQPKGMTMRELNEGFAWMVGQIFSPEDQAERIEGEMERLTRGTPGRLTDHSRAFLFGALGWVLAWYILDRNRARLLRLFFLLMPRALFWPPGAFETLLVRLAQYRHNCRVTDEIDKTCRIVIEALDLEGDEQVGRSLKAA